MNLETSFAPITRLVFLAETKCNSRHIDHIKCRLDLFGFGVDSRGRSGGLALLWDKSVNVIIQSLSQSHIEATVILDGGIENLRFTGFYGDLDKKKVVTLVLNGKCRAFVMPFSRVTFMILTLKDPNSLGQKTIPSLIPSEFDLTERVAILHGLIFSLMPRGKTAWLREGGRNTKIFHSKASERKRTNTISRLKDDSGNFWDQPEDFQRLILEYFSNLFTSDHPSGVDIDQGIEHIEPRVDEDLAAELSRPYMEDEIASKSIANKLKPFLDSMISPSQAAFIPNRLITDNALIAFELNHFLSTRTKGKKDFMALKLDISKAYDKVKWLILKKVMIKLGFPLSFVNFVMTCVSTVSYSFIVNGHQFGSITPQRGLPKETPSPPISSCCVQKL
ncbi:UNVERIFIED_CONTAM: hypothetical protein Sradi_0152000 [Sesamum radiatum]|uniref:Reverse transcriptase domain-containing protein n=1 Tax=Sesamum radiatum TaxID=300843 RepID=A0AAW2WLN8_SESRA